MTDERRWRRPRPERYGPIRDWFTLFWPSRPSAEHDPYAPNGDAEASRHQEGAPRGFGETVADAVERGYEVINENIRQGQRVAERIGTSRYSPNDLGEDIQEAMMRFWRYNTEFAMIWLDLVTRAMSPAAREQSGGFPGNGTEEPVDGHPRDYGPFGPWARAGQHDRGQPPSDNIYPDDDVHDYSQAVGAPAGEPDDNGLRVSLEVVLDRRSTVTFEVPPHYLATNLATDGLRARGTATPPITQVLFRPATDVEPAHLTISVPEDQPPGIYSGVVVDDDTEEVRGTLSLRIHPDGE